MCGIAGIVALSRRRGATLDVKRSLRMAARSPPRPGRVRPLPRRTRGAGARPPVDHRPRRPASSRWPTRRHDRGSCFNGEIFNYVELRDELSGARPPLPHAQRHRGHRPRLSRRGARRAFERINGQWALALWDAVAPRLVLARDRTRRLPALLLRARRPPVLRQRSQGDLRRRCRRSRAPSIRSASTRPSRSGRSCRRKRVFRGIEELEPGHVRIYEQRRSFADSAFWKPRYPEVSGARRPVRRLPRRRRRGGAQRRSKPPRRCACCAPMCRSAATSPAASTARWSPRWAGAYAGERFHTFSLRFEDAEYDETVSSA